MKNLKILLAMLVLALVVIGCRTVPAEIIKAHQDSMWTSERAFGIAESTMIQIEDKSTELNEFSVSLAFAQWTKYINQIIVWRSTVRRYLIEAKADANVIGPYGIGYRLLVDMHTGFHTINHNWKNMIEADGEANATKLIELFRKDIQRFKILERKFDEWIRQFKVKG